MDWYDPPCYSIKILDAKYSKVQINDVVNRLLGHLNVQQTADVCVSFGLRLEVSYCQAWDNNL